MSDLYPLLDRDRYSDEEWEYASAGKCDVEVESGMVWGRVVRCGEASDPGSFYRYCTDHDRCARDESTNYGQ